MHPKLREETTRLERSWMQHSEEKLRDYLVSGVEDPRLNLQSIFSRHFIIRGLFGEAYEPLMAAECQFSAVMNWLNVLVRREGHPDSMAAVLHAIQHGSDNAEGIEIPHFILDCHRDLRPGGKSAGVVPEDYLEAFLVEARDVPSTPFHRRGVLNTFAEIWEARLRPVSVTARPSVIEPACGSANDYRYLEIFGISRLIDYAGFDLCEKNVTNARMLFPGAAFEKGNVFSIPRADREIELCVVHDLFEHLSPAGLEAALAEVCRVTRRGMCLGFFNMDEIAEHVVRPMDEYHWNTLSMSRVKESLAGLGFGCRVIHVETFLRQRLGCESTHNPAAYTVICWRG